MVVRDILFQAVLCGVSSEHLFMYQMPSQVSACTLPCFTLKQLA